MTIHFLTLFILPIKDLYKHLLERGVFYSYSHLCFTYSFSRFFFQRLVAGLSFLFVCQCILFLFWLFDQFFASPFVLSILILTTQFLGSTMTIILEFWESKASINGKSPL